MTRAQTIAFTLFVLCSSKVRAAAAAEAASAAVAAAAARAVAAAARAVAVAATTAAGRPARMEKKTSIRLLSGKRGST